MMLPNLSTLLKSLWLCFCLIPCYLSSQALYTGHVSDLGNREDLQSVKVEIRGSSKQSLSNIHGDFLVKTAQQGNLPTGQLPYTFYNNSVIWQGDLKIGLEIFAIDGKLVFSQNQLGTNGNFIFPRLQTGLYLLRFTTPSNQETFKAFSDGIKTRVADQRATRYQSQIAQQTDTLLFTKDGYYPRRILVHGRDTTLEVNMLKGRYQDLDYFNELIDPISFELVSSSPSRTNYGGIQSIKIIYNTQDDLLYYANTKKYQLHYTFANKFLGFRQSNGIFNQTQYRENDNRYLYPAALNYYEALDKYVLQFVAANEMSCERIQFLYDKIIETSYLEGKLYFFANSAEWMKCNEVPTISSDELYNGQNYQALNLTENYGYLNKVELDKLESTYLGRRDLVLLNGIPNDVPVVAGIITTEFQTPLSHINILSHSRGTPNMALRDGWDNEQLEPLIGQLVYLNVMADSFLIRPASLAEAEAFWKKTEPQDSIFLDKNTELQGLVDLYTADHTYVDRIGGKAANYAEILKVQFNGQPIPTPEDAFAIPFYYYEQHMKKAGLDVQLRQMLTNEDFKSDPIFRRQALLDLQSQIRSFPLDPTLAQLVKNRLQNFAQFSAYRFRSSTNAEDLEGFSGAGLYNSHSAKKEHDKKTIENAIRKVWASLWNWRAFEERAYYKIDHRTCAMGILVARSFPDEDANGVIITKNLYNFNPGFIINAQYKEYSIVFPEPGIIHDQIMLHAWSIVPGEKFMIEYLTFSNIPELNGEPVLTEEEIIELGNYCMAVKIHFYENVPHNCNCEFDDFGLDIEFKVDSQVSPRKVYLKQARRF